jgi:excisionase family DNA binding protein
MSIADEEYLTPAQVAEQLNLNAVTVRRWIANGELRASRIGRRKWMIRRYDLARYLSAGTPEPIVDASEDPSFDKHLVAPGER